MLKPSLAFSCIGLMMLRRGWVGRYLPDSTAGLIPSRLVVLTGYAYAIALFGLAGANLAVANLASQKDWAIYSTAAPIVVFSILGAGVAVVFRRVGRRNFRARAAQNRRAESESSTEGGAHAELHRPSGR